MHPPTLFYSIKPFIPRSLQIFLRRKLVSHQLQAGKAIWPIDKSAAKIPDKWVGWPEKKNFALILIHDVDTQKGHDNCSTLMKLEQEMGFQSIFYFVPERYNVSENLRKELANNGFEVGVHGLKHDGRLFSSKKIFDKRALRINYYLKQWNSFGFSSPAMHHQLNWMHKLNINFATTTFDTDPFEPQPDGVKTIFPFKVNNESKSHIELPYTMPQDFTLYILMKERNIEIWKKKLDWIAENGGMVLLNTHPDYMDFSKGKTGRYKYPAVFYRELLEYINTKYGGKYWHILSNKVANFWMSSMSAK